MKILELFAYIFIFAIITSFKYNKKKIIERLEIKSKFTNKKLSQKLGQKLS